VLGVDRVADKLLPNAGNRVAALGREMDGAAAVCWPSDRLVVFSAEATIDHLAFGS